MKKILSSTAAGLLVMALAATLLIAAETPQPGPEKEAPKAVDAKVSAEARAAAVDNYYKACMKKVISAEDSKKMLAAISHYPDGLVAQVVQAAQCAAAVSDDENPCGVFSGISDGARYSVEIEVPAVPARKDTREKSGDSMKTIWRTLGADKKACEDIRQTVITMNKAAVSLDTCMKELPAQCSRITILDTGDPKLACEVYTSLICNVMELGGADDCKDLLPISRKFGAKDADAIGLCRISIEGSSPDVPDLMKSVYLIGVQKKKKWPIFEEGFNTDKIALDPVYTLIREVDKGAVGCFSIIPAESKGDLCIGMANREAGIPYSEVTGAGTESPAAAPSTPADDSKPPPDTAPPPKTQ